MKREAKLKSAFGEALQKRKRSWLNFSMLTAGAPDRVIIGSGETSFWEFKHATPGFDSPGLQELICKRIATQGKCYYVVWYEDANGQNKRTIIVHPEVLIARRHLEAVMYCDGFDMEWLVEHVIRLHLT